MLQKQPLNINFSQGLDTKTDPFQVSAGKFLSLQNSIFTKGGLLQKRNGFGSLPNLPDSSSTFLSTFNGDLTAIGTSLRAYSSGTMSWVNKGSLTPLSLTTLPLIRNNFNQNQSDTAISSNGLVCTVYTENNGSSNSFKYAIADSVTGQNIVSPTVISGADSTYGTPKVFALVGNFIIIYATTGPSYTLSFIAISITNPTSTPIGPTIISNSYAPSTTLAFDGSVATIGGATSLFIAWNGAAGSGLTVSSIQSNLQLSGQFNPDPNNQNNTLISVCVDPIGFSSVPAIWVTYYNSGTNSGSTVALNQNLSVISGFPVSTISLANVVNLASAAQTGVMTLFYEVSNTLSYGQSDFIKTLTVTQSSAAVSATTVLVRSVGLASKAFIVGGVIYFLSTYFIYTSPPATLASSYQPTYFLISSAGNTVAKIAYENGGGYLTTGLPNVNVSGNVASISYLYKDLIQSVNKNTNVTAGNQVNGIYSQTGVNLASFTIGGVNLSTAEIGSNLNLSGGFMWAYDGYTPVEQGFFLYPECITATWSATGGSMAAKPDTSTNTNAYFYQVTYEWSDNQGNLFRSAPSIPIAVNTTGSGSSGSVSLVIPTLRITYKIASPVKIVVYRWSVAQTTYYQTTSISSPTLNSVTADSVTFVDTLADMTILGNNVLYTTGGVVENVSPSAIQSLFLFDDRVFVVNSEDRNLIGFSKQVIEATPVEISDLFTIYVAPTLSSEGSSGQLNFGFPMDDKAILFKDNAIYYFNGTGPDNTGSNNQYSPPILVTTTVGSANQNSVVFMPNGLMFQSNKGIWLLGRDLSTTYIGAPVEQFNSATVTSAMAIPGTNQVRFALNNGITLMYDYYYNQWGTFINVPSISATLYQGLHTYINSFGKVFQETPGVYLDGSSPVLLGFTTSWMNLAGLRGYERIYEFSFLGVYYSPHKLSVQVAYDYNPPSHQSIYSPDNFSNAYGLDPLYGDGNPYGGPSNIEGFRVFAVKQKCQAFQISVQEVFDASFGVPAGAGVTLSGINMVVGIKKGWSPVRGKNSIG